MLSDACANLFSQVVLPGFWVVLFLLLLVCFRIVVIVSVVHRQWGSDDKMVRFWLCYDNIGKRYCLSVSRTSS